LLESSTADEGGKAIPLAGFGAPVLRGTPARLSFSDRSGQQLLIIPGQTRDGGRIADVARLRELPSLPFASRELEGLRDLLGASATTIHIGIAATEAAVRTSDLRKTAIIAFATHGLMPGDGGLSEPGLVLTPPKRASDEDDGLLTAAEITTLRLRADLVILSACNTAAGSDRAEPGLSGLARSFFYAGARSLLVSHWRIRDDIAAELTVDTVRRKRASASGYAEALQGAMRSIRNDLRDPSRAHPAAWAPFVIVGDVRQSPTPGPTS
ncbi:MAG: hypothetical protein B7Y00_01855, partial [Sphingomonadales bacterium 17-56-6]